MGPMTALVLRFTIGFGILFGFPAAPAGGVTNEVYFTHPFGGIRAMDPSGRIRPVSPQSGVGLTFDRYQNLYFVRPSRYRGDLLRMTPSGRTQTVTTLFDDPDPIGVGAWNIDIAVDARGQVFYTHPRGGIFAVDATGNTRRVLSGAVSALDLDTAGNLHVATYGRYEADILRIAPGQATQTLGTFFDDPSPIGMPAWDMDLAVNRSGDIYYTHPRGGIWRLDGLGPAELVLPDAATSVAFDEHDNLYFARYSRYHGDLMRLSPDGDLRLIATVFDDPNPIGLSAWDTDIAVMPPPVPEPLSATSCAIGILAVALSARRTLAASREGPALSAAGRRVCRFHTRCADSPDRVAVNSEV